MIVTVLLVDDHPMIRQGLRNLLETEGEFKVVGEAGDGIQGLKLAERTRPRVMVVDIMMPGLNGLEVVRQVKQRLPLTHVIVFSMHSADGYVTEALKAGAAGYVLKDSGPSELARAIRQVVGGKRYLSPKLSKHLIAALNQNTDEITLDPYDSLTNREREVLQMAAESLTNVEIADKLSISSRTVEVHRSRVMKKLDLKNQSELIHYALNRGILLLNN
jgi:two-component system, NarL family, response regulator NreC